MGRIKKNLSPRDNFATEKTKLDQALIREKTQSTLINQHIEKNEKLSSDLTALKSLQDKTKQELDSRWSKKEQEIRENRLKSALESAKNFKSNCLEFEKAKNLAVSENTNLKERIASLNNQISRQKSLVDDSKSRLLSEKSKIENLSKSKNDFENKLEQCNVDLGHKKLHISNLKRQINLMKEKYLKEEETGKIVKAELVKASAEKVSLCEKVLELKKKLKVVEETAEESILGLLDGGFVFLFFLFSFFLCAYFFPFYHFHA